MARKKEKEIIHQQDILIKTFGTVSAYVRDNTRQCVFGLIALLVIVAGIVSYFVYAGQRDQRIQYELAQGIQAFESYERTRAAGDIEKAEGIFKKISAATGGKSHYIATLYLAKINVVQGRTEEALKLYKEVSGKSSNQAMAYLADKAIGNIEKK